GVGLASVFHTLLVKSPCLARVSSAEPVLLGRLGRSLWEVAPLLGACFAAVGWPSEEDATTRSLAEQAEALIAYGSDAALAALRAEALQRQQERWPRRTLSPEEASQVHQLRAAWQVRPDARVLTSAGTQWTVIYTEDPAPEAGGQNRVVWVKAVENAVRGLP